MNIKITGTGSCIPEKIIRNSEFTDRVFYDMHGKASEEHSDVVCAKFEKITGIAERRYVDKDEDITDLATSAAIRAISDSGADPESIDLIILAHNFGSIPHGSSQQDAVPSIASRVKFRLGIMNPECVAYDVLFGCPGWLQGLIIARQHITGANGGKALIVGADVLSRVLDPYDRDSMIFADGAGAVVIESTGEGPATGIISSTSQTHSVNETFYIDMGVSNKKVEGDVSRYLKMTGRNVYEFALTHVPAAMKKCLEKSGHKIGSLKKIFLHQANKKMDEAILKEFYRLYNIVTPPANIMPMNIESLGNSSVATIPTLFDSVMRNQLPEHSLEKGDLIIFASVGAGMNLNAMTYIV